MKLIKLFLLLSMFFNITHASVIAMEDDCHHNTVAEYLMEQNIADDCGDLCDMDHFFHFIAILSTAILDFDTSTTVQPTQKSTLYYPPFKETSTKPPIV